MTKTIVARLLGPIEVTGPQGTATLAGARQRSLVALLALQVGQAITAERLVEGLWGHGAPRTAVRTLQSHLARIRQALWQVGLPGVIHSGPAGHVLRLPADAVDVHVFADLVRQARSCLETGSAREAVALLQRAHGLWRGDALTDGEVNGWAQTEVERWHDARLSALEDLADARLRLGEHAAVLGDLHQLLAAHPYREKSAALLMLALYRSSRGADALNVYQRIRGDLAEGLGVDPGAELQKLYSALLRQDPSLDLSPRPEQIARPAGPAQLPPRAGYFTGRATEFAGLDSLVTEAGADDEDKIVVISGPAGMGKTAFAVQWAHHASRWFPDGQFFLDLQGHDPQATLSPAAVLGHLLLGLGVPPDRVPSDPAGLASLYRSLIHQRRSLIVLDNARELQQVSLAIPPTRSSLLIITSRRDLSALAVGHPVHFVQMAALDQAEGLDLLRRAVDRQRIDAEAGAAAELIGFCGGMPLAVRISAARLATRPGLAMAELVADLRERQLDALAVPGDSAGIRAVFASAYRGLSEPTRRTFRLLSVHPGPTFTAALAAQVADSPAGEVDRHLAELVGASLIGQAEGRCQFHDLVRLYAAECARVEEPAERIAEAETRLLDWYLDVAYEANRVLGPGRNRVKREASISEVPFGPSAREAVDFLEGERPSLGPVVRKAAALGRHAAAWQLTYLVAGFYDSRGSYDRLEVCEVAVRAAQELADPEAEILMRNLYAATCVMMNRFDDALAQLELALPLAVAAQDTWLLAATHTNIAVANTWLHRYDAAQDSYERALAIHTANGDRHSIALALNNIGDLMWRAGRAEAALEHLANALELTSTLDSPRLEAIVRQSIGQAHQSRSDHAAALQEFHRALLLRRQIGDRRGEAAAVQEIGATLLEGAQIDEAVAAFRQAQELSRLLGNEHLEATVLNQLGEALLHAGDLSGAAEALEQSGRLRARIPDPPEESHLRRNLDRLRELAG